MWCADLFPPSPLLAPVAFQTAHCSEKAIRSCCNWLILLRASTCWIKLSCRLSIARYTETPGPIRLSRVTRAISKETEKTERTEISISVTFVPSCSKLPKPAQLNHRCDSDTVLREVMRLPPPQLFPQGEREQIHLFCFCS